MTSPPAATRRWPWYLAAILLLLTVVGGAATLLLDRYLTSLAREQASRLATAWQRPVEIGAVRTAFLTGLGVRVEGVRIGPGAGETRSLLELDRAEVRLDLPRAVRTGGRELSIRNAELRGLRVVVVRARDGSTNVARLAEALSRGTPPAPATPTPPAAPAGPGAAGPEPVDRSRFRVEHAAVVGARLTLVDEGTGGPELAVDRIDLTVDGLAAGAPLEVILRAGLLSTTQNLLLKLHAPALPASLVPTPDRLTLRLTPVDLTPLAPFAPRGAGFLGGRVTADLDVALGGAMPGGQGLTTVRGGFAATGLRFVGQEGGKALDVTLDVDVTGDAERGDLAIGKLLLAFGPATLEGKGKVTGLRSDRPALEGLRLTASHLDPAALAAWYPPLPRLIGGTVAGPVGLSLEAEGTAAQPILRLRADLTPVRLAFAGLLEKAAGGPLVLAARLRPGERGALGFEVEADLTGLDLRPGGTLAKRPGDRFTLAAAGSRRVAGETQSLELTSLAASLLETNLKGHGTLELGPGSRRFELDLAIDRVDADRLLAPAPPRGSAAKPGDAGPARDAARGAPSPYAGLAGRLTLQVGAAQARKQKLTDLRATVVVKEDEVTLPEARLAAWQGRLDLSGTSARLAPADRPFTVRARVDGVEVGQALSMLGDKEVLTGRLDAELRASGKGRTGDDIRRALDGTVEGKLSDGVFHGLDLVAGVTEPLVKAVPSLRGKVASAGKTSLGKVVPVSLRIQGGRALLQRPLEIEDRGATASVRGAVGLDGELDLPVTMSLPPAMVADLTGGKARPKAPLPFTFSLAGKAWSPRMAGLDVRPAATTLLESVGVEPVKKKLEDEGKKALKKLFGK